MSASCLRERFSKTLWTACGLSIQLLNYKKKKKGKKRVQCLALNTKNKENNIRAEICQMPKKNLLVS